MHRIKNQIDRGLFEALGDYDDYIDVNVPTMVCSPQEDLPWIYGPSGEVIAFFDPNIRIGFRNDS